MKFWCGIVQPLHGVGEVIGRRVVEVLHGQHRVNQGKVTLVDCCLQTTTKNIIAIYCVETSLTFSHTFLLCIIDKITSGYLWG